MSSSGYETIRACVPCFDMQEPILAEPGPRESYRARTLADFCLNWAGLGYVNRETARQIRGIRYAESPDLLKMIYLAKLAFCEIHKTMLDSLADGDLEEDPWNNFASGFHRSADLYLQVISFPSKTEGLLARRIHAVRMHAERRKFERHRNQVSDERANF